MPVPGCACGDKPPEDNTVVATKHVTFGDYSKEAMGESSPDYSTILPQPGDEVPDSSTKDQKGNHMGPIGPWATGRVDWGVLSGLTGTRPVVDHYSITRFSTGEWRKHNKDVLCGSSEDQYRSNLAELSSRQAMQTIASSADKNQHDSTLRLGERAHDLHRWKSEVEQAIQDMVLELELLESQRRRARQAKAVLGIVKSINAECLGRRALRMEQDLVRDVVEEELIKEAALVKEVGDLIDRTLVQIEEQLERNKAVKARLEDDWSDKKESYEIETTNISLNNKSTLILFKPGATRFTDSQSTPLGWEDNCRDVLQMAEAVKGQSCELRTLLNGPILSDCVRDLRAQADKVDIAFTRRIAETDLCRQALENELCVVVRRIAETEKLVTELRGSMRGIDYSMKVAQTRLDNRQRRPRIENTRDDAQYGLTTEVKSVAEHASMLNAQLKQSEQCLVGLQSARGDIERELQTKLKTLYIDKERCQEARAHYPSATAMSGH